MRNKMPGTGERAGGLLFRERLRHVQPSPGPSCDGCQTSGQDTDITGMAADTSGPRGLSTDIRHNVSVSNAAGAQFAVTLQCPPRYVQ